MCLQIILTVKRINDDQAKKIAGAIQQPNFLTLKAFSPRKWFRKQSPIFYLSKNGGCACSLLADDAGWENEYWQMDSKILEKMANTLREFNKKIKTQFTFEAVWLGDEILKEKSLPLEDLLFHIENNKIETKTCYKII